MDSSIRVETQYKGCNTLQSGKSISELPFLDFNSIAAAMDNFSTTNKLGVGGFGPIYKEMLHLHNENMVACSLCSETIQRELLALHKGETCPQRIVTCEYCEFPLPAVDLCMHQDVCGNRTDYCDICNKYIRRHERNEHDRQLHSSMDSIAESSRDESLSEREQDYHRRQPRDLSQKRIWFTIAITGIAVLMGSIFLQRRADNHQQ